jgi:hypothetical protein
MSVSVSVVFCQVEVSGRADHSPRGVLPSVLCLSMIVMPRRKEGKAMTRRRAEAP